MKLTPKLNKKDSLLLLGHNGLIGSALLKQLKNRNYKNIIIVEKKKLNLLNFSKIENFFKKKKKKNKKKKKKMTFNKFFKKKKFF